MLRTRPGFAAAAVLSLGLGIGASTAIFSIVDAVLLRDLPYPESERIVQIREVNDKGTRIRVAEPNYVDVRDRNKSLESIAQFAGGPVVVTGGSEAVRANAFWVSGDFFRTLGIQPEVGRTFLPDESRPGGVRVAVVSHGFWHRSLGGRDEPGGMSLNVDGVVFAVVGVMPREFDFPSGADIWVPREVDPPQTSRTAHNWSVIGRLRSGVTLAQARAEISSIARQLRQEHTNDTDAADIAAIPMKEFLTDDVRSGLEILVVAVGLLLLVACANVANLLLGQAAARSSELAVRGALGATRWRITRQFIAENLLLALAAGATGVVLAFWGVELLVRLNQGNLPREDEIAINVRVLIFTVGLASVIAVALAFAPAARFSRRDLQSSLKEAGRGGANSSGGSRLRGLLVVTQVGLTMVLLIGAGLLARGFLKLLNTDPGFRPESAVAMGLALPTTIDKSEEQRLLQFHQQLLERVERVPGVIAVGRINALPLTGRGANGSFLLDGNPDATGQAEYRLASPGYFPAMGIPLLRGRLFDKTDNVNTAHVAVISQSLALKYWPNEDPIGRAIQFGNMDGDRRLLHIVGIVGDVRQRGLDEQIGDTVYAYSLQRPQWWQVSNLRVVVRAESDPAVLIPALRAVVQSLDRDIPISFQTLDQIVSSSLDTRRFSLVIFGAFATVALLLAAAGVYSVMSYNVTQRTHEIGVRVALGAQTGDVLAMIVKQGMTLAIVGLGIGLLASLGLTRLMESLLFGVSANDPLTFGVVTLLIVGVAILACWIPARRASRVDPMTALRNE
jgi:predicted permease